MAKIVEKKKKELRVLGYMKENTKKQLPLVSGGNQKQCSMTESSQGVYPAPIYFWPTFPPTQKSISIEIAS